MKDKPDLTALMGSRLCHDLISPLGAIANGLELLLMDGKVKGPEITLIAQSVASANARVRFFRVAFGTAGADQRIGLPEVSSILADITRGTRLSVDWQARGDHARVDVKMVFLAVQCLEAAMPWGGRIVISRDGDGWRAAANAHKFRDLGAQWDIVSGVSDGSALTPAEVQFGLLGSEAARRGKQPVAVRITDASIVIEF